MMNLASFSLKQFSLTIKYFNVINDYFTYFEISDKYWLGFLLEFIEIIYSSYFKLIFILLFVLTTLDFWLDLGLIL